MSFFIPEAMAAEGAAPPTGGPAFIEPLILIGFVAIFYFLIWRPQSKRAKEHRELVSGLSKGDEVVTGGGMVGEITKVEEQFVVVRVADGVELRFQKNAIGNTLPKGTIKSLDAEK